MTQEIRKLEVVVETSKEYDGHDLEIRCWETISRKIINQYDSSDRQWLARHAWWAMHNNMRITTYPL